MTNTKKLLLPFYFGALSEAERLETERLLLTDAELLTAYLDLKRDLEAAPLPATAPSPGLWQTLKPKTRKQKTFYVSLSLGAAIAASLAIMFSLQSRPNVIELVQPSASKVLFDSSAELPVSSGVL